MAIGFVEVFDLSSRPAREEVGLARVGPDLEALRQALGGHFGVIGGQGRAGGSQLIPGPGVRRTETAPDDEDEEQKEGSP